MTQDEWLAEAPPRQRDAMLAAWDLIAPDYGTDDAAMREALRTAVGLAEAYNHNPGAVDTRLVVLRKRLTDARREMAVVTAQSKVAAAMLLHHGETQMGVEAKIGFRRTTILRWFGKGTR